MNATATNEDILIVGYGNDLLGDDGVGWVAAARLNRELHSIYRIEIETVHQLTPELVEKIARFGLVIFIDASAVGEPGQISCRRIFPSVIPSRVSHVMGPERLLNLMCRSRTELPQVLVLTITGEFFGYREGLSQTAQSALPELFERIANLVRWWEHRPSPRQMIPCDKDPAFAAKGI